MKHLLASTALAIALAATSAHATCISSLPINAPDPTAGTTCPITASGSTVDIVFAYKSAADLDLLINGVSMTTLIKNTDPLGTEAVLTGLVPGSTLNLVWENMTTGAKFKAGVPAADGIQHIAVRSTFADFQTDPPRTHLTLADLGPAASVMAGIKPISDWAFVGMEDLLSTQPFSDFDYNDLIFGLLGITPQGKPPEVSEPPTLALIGIGLLAFGFYRTLQRRAAERAALRNYYPLGEYTFITNSSNKA